MFQFHHLLILYSKNQKENRCKTYFLLNIILITKPNPIHKLEIDTSIDINGISCETDHTVVKVVKYREKYFYKAYIGCGSNENGSNKVEASIFRPEDEPVTKESLCDSDIGASMNIIFRPNKDTSGTKKQIKPRITIESYST